MKIIEQSFEILTPPQDEMELLKWWEPMARVCYKSEDKITDDSSIKLFKKLKYDLKHESVFEHINFTVRFITNRGVTHELVRHRIASYSQESTRYVKSVSKYIFINNNDDVINAYDSGISMKLISKRSKGKYTENQVNYILSKNNTNKRSVGNTGKVNDDYLNTIDSWDKAYFIGLFQGDGNLRRNSNQMNISQKDMWYIERFIKSFLKPNVTTHADRDSKCLSFSSKTLYNRFIEIGIMPNKTYDQTKNDVIKLVNSIPENLLVHFIRGLLDSDGNVRFFYQNDKSSSLSVNFGLTLNKHLSYILKELLCNKYALNVGIDECENINRIRITDSEKIIPFLTDMYNNFIFPYGHPIKTSRVFDFLNFKFQFDDYGDERFKIILPMWYKNILNPSLWTWAEHMDNSESTYSRLLDLGQTPQQARGVLPIDLKTEIVVTANLREWWHIFKLRTSKEAHPQIRDLMLGLQNEFRKQYPILFEEKC